MYAEPDKKKTCSHLLGKRLPVMPSLLHLVDVLLWELTAVITVEENEHTSHASLSLCPPHSSPSATWTCWWPARNARSSWGTSTALSATVSDAKPRTRYVARRQIATFQGGFCKVFWGPLLLVPPLQRALGGRTERKLHSLFPGTFDSAQVRLKTYGT